MGDFCQSRHIVHRTGRALRTLSSLEEKFQEEDSERIEQYILSLLSSALSAVGLSRMPELDPKTTFTRARTAHDADIVKIESSHSVAWR